MSRRQIQDEVRRQGARLKSPGHVARTKEAANALLDLAAVDNEETAAKARSAGRQLTRQEVLAKRGNANLTPAEEAEIDREIEGFRKAMRSRKPKHPQSIT